MGTTSTAKRFLSARLAVAAALGLGLIIACHTEGSLVRAEWMGAWLWLLPAVAAAEWLRRRRLRRGEETSLPWELWPAAALAVLMVVYLFTSAAYDRHFFFLDWGSAPGWRALMLDSWPGKLMLCTAVLTPLFFFYRRGLWILTFTLLVFSQMRCIHEFVLNTHGTTLYGFDHPSFMHRFWAFGRTFPQLIYYDPFWNGGKAATYLISSGSTALGLLLWPLWKFASIDKVYTPAIGFVFIVLVPFAIAFAVRAARGSWTAAFAAGLLALGVSRHWFIWLLHFGTVSSCLALALAALVGAFLYRVLCLDVRTAATGAGLVVSAFLVVTWPPAGIMLLPPLALAFVAGARQWTARKWVFLLGCGVVVAALFLPYVLGILQRTRVDYYMQGSDEAVQWAEVLKDGLAHVPGYLIASHPLLVFLGFAGAFFVARRAASVYFGAVVLGLLAVAAWGEAIKPELEL
ncbi:MAG: hypothetical protein JXB04_05720, partial [Kiritimatiellae bacterium]|nr:hypothetical protein [Kiritimatiellia bacterium]